MSAALLCGGVKTSCSQFITVPATNTHPAEVIYDACGPNSASAAARWADQSLTAPSTLTVYQKMRSLGLGGDSGVSTLSDLETTLAKLGYQIITPNAGESPFAFMGRMAGRAAVVWETNVGQVLVDSLTGLGEDAVNLERHYLTSWGTWPGGAAPFAGGKVLPAGFLCSDGCNDSQNLVNGVRFHRPLNQQLVFYPTSLVLQSQPIGAFAVAARVPIPVEVHVTIPIGWHDDGTSAYAPNGGKVGGGMRVFVLGYPGGWRADNMPISTEQHVDQVELSHTSHGPGTVQYFHYSMLALPDGPTPDKHVVYEAWIGDEARYLGGSIVSLQQALTAANSRIAALQQAVDPQVVAAVAAFKKALGL